MDMGVETIFLPLNSADALLETLAKTEPDVAVFDRFYLEEQFSAGVRKLRPGTVRVLDMQDSHALRLSRQRCVLNEGGSIMDAIRTFPTATDATHAREFASILRSDLTFACSQVEHDWLRDTCSIPPHKLALAPLFYDARDVDDAGRPFDARSGFVSLGSFRHPPNVDATNYLAREVWPRVRASLPDARITIIGSHPTREAMALHAPNRGVLVAGHVSSVELRAHLSRARALLAPLRFGAGLKGKVLDAWSQGTPVVTTPIGSEGMRTAAQPPTGSRAEDAPSSWGGLCDATDAAGLAADAVRLHTDRTLWEQTASSATRLRTALFDEAPLLHGLRHAVEAALEERTARRAADFSGAAMWHHRQRSTELLAKYIELKEATKRLQT